MKLKRLIMCIIYLLICAIALIMLNLSITKKNDYNTYMTYFDINELNMDRLTYPESFFSDVDSEQYETIYNLLSESSKKEYGKVEELKSKIQEIINTSSDIYNQYDINIKEIKKETDKIVILYMIDITSYDKELYMSHIFENKGKKTIYIEMEEYGPMKYNINKIYEIEE